MNDAEVERQIDQMVKFIKQEAEEKANEISVSAEEEFNIEKLQLIDQEKKKIKQDYERREGQIDVKKRIEYSKQLNNSRIAILRAREEALQSIVQEAESKLSQVTKSKKRYTELLTSLILQGASKLAEKNVVIQGREQDAAAVKEAAKNAESQWKEKFGSEPPKMTVSEEFLAAGSKNADEHNSCDGGVVIKNSDGSIVCSQKLEDRLQIAYSQNLPYIREQLFGAAQG